MDQLLREKIALFFWGGEGAGGASFSPAGQANGKSQKLFPVAIVAERHGVYQIRRGNRDNLRTLAIFLHKKHIL